MFNRFIRQTGLAAIALAAGLSAQAAVVVSKDNSTVNAIPGLTGFATTGAMMDGMRVTATFSLGLTQTLVWADTGAASGGVFGSGWSLTESGDTFGNNWLFAFEDDAVIGQLVQLVLDASGPRQVTVFDATDPSFGTDGSAQGADFAIQTGCSNCSGTAVYSNAISVTPNAPVGDIYHTLTVTFDSGTGPRTNWSFRQDTDNDVRLNTGFVPEPSMLALAGLGLALTGAARRRRAR